MAVGSTHQLEHTYFHRVIQVSFLPIGLSDPRGRGATPWTQQICNNCSLNAISLQSNLLNILPLSYSINTSLGMLSLSATKTLPHSPSLSYWICFNFFVAHPVKMTGSWQTLQQRASSSLHSPRIPWSGFQPLLCVYVYASLKIKGTSCGLTAVVTLRCMVQQPGLKLSLMSSQPACSPLPPWLDNI